LSPLEWVAAAVSAVAVYLTTRQIIWCWPTALVSVALYAVVFFQAKLYANMGLQAVFFAISLYGWWAWLHGGEDHGKLEVSLASTRTRIMLLVIGAVTGALMGLILNRLTDASIPYIDSALSAFSIVAQWMQSRKLLETWLLWIAVDVGYVGMFLYKGLYPTTALYAAFLYLAALGFVRWRRSMVESAAPTSPEE
jgi:nicotinamide mononucleotide transporter